MLRSAAKNFRSVAVINSSLQYEPVLKELKESGCQLSEHTLRELAMQVFSKTSRYDGLIARYLAKEKASNHTVQDFPERFDLELHKIRELRYGENPHQRGAFYRDTSKAEGCIVDAEQVQGKELSYNNILDLNAALEIVKEFDHPAVSIVKHNNPCGAASSATLERAYMDALDCDRMSAFGSIMAFNSPIDSGLAKVILDAADFIECIIAPGYEEEALKVFKAKKNLRVMNIASLAPLPAGTKDISKIPGGALLQDADLKSTSAADMKIVTRNKPSAEQREALLFGCKVVKYVKSNAIVLCRGTKTVGIGAGQMSRVDSVQIAIRKAGERAKGAVMASDAFFPMADSIEEAHKAGIAAVVQPGGSIRDKEVIDACDRYGIPMALTGTRHFRH